MQMIWQGCSGVDAVRYFVLHEMPFEHDGVISWELMVERMNSDLANTLGNLVNRTISMSNKYFDGIVEDKGAEDEFDDQLKAVVTGAREKVQKKMDVLRVADAMTKRSSMYLRDATNILTRRCRGYWQKTMPRRTAWQRFCIIW